MKIKHDVYVFLMIFVLLKLQCYTAFHGTTHGGCNFNGTKSHKTNSYICEL